MNHDYRKGRRHSVPADEVVREMERIWHENGQRLMPRDVVDEATDEASPLHPLFDWNDASAGDQWRLQQARLLIRDVRLELPDGRKVQRFTHVRLEHEDKVRNFYQDVLVLPQRPLEYQGALKEARRKLQEATESFEAVQRIVATDGDDAELRKLAMIAEALTTAHTLAQHLQ